MKDRGIRIDSSRISRWESGLEYISPSLVEAYEAVAGLQPAQIGAVRRVLARDGRLLTRSTERPSGPADPERIDELIDGLETGHGSAATSGSGWPTSCDSSRPSTCTAAPGRTSPTSWSTSSLGPPASPTWRATRPRQR